MKTALNYIFGILLIISLIAVGILSYQNYQYRITPPEKISIHDTTIIKKDSIIEKVKWKTKFDTIIDFQYKDTIIHDTIQIPIEHKVSEFNLKKDSFELKQKIHHSGFYSVIDSVECSYSFNYEVKPPKPKKFGWCVTFGPSVTYGVNFNTGNKTFDYGPSLGISVVIGPSYIIK